MDVKKKKGPSPWTEGVQLQVIMILTFALDEGEHVENAIWTVPCPVTDCPLLQAVATGKLVRGGNATVDSGGMFRYQKVGEWDLLKC